MKEFETWMDYWKFAHKVCHNYRYFHDDWLSNFFQNIIDSAKARTEVIPKGKILFRAQLGNTTVPMRTPIETEKGRELKEIERSPVPYPPERMKPIPSEAREGRANPKGIPYLYLANKEETALSEVRPWQDSRITLAKFKTVKQLKVINCSKDRAQKVWYMGQNPSSTEKEELIWTLINHAFSVPTTSSDSKADYCPTQILAEFFKRNEFDGVVYRSMLGSKDGYNIALFDLQSAEVVDVSLYTTKSLNYEFERIKKCNIGSWYLYSDMIEKEYEDFVKD